MLYKTAEYRAYHRAYNKKRYVNDAEFRQRCRDAARIYRKRRYADDPEFRQRCLDAIAIWKRQNPLKYRDLMRLKANRAVSQKVSKGHWYPATKLLCAWCGFPASHYHHYLGYEQKHWYDVIALCTICHGLTRRKSPSI